MEWTGTKLSERETLSLVEKALNALENREVERADRFGKKLISGGRPEGWEIRAKAVAQGGDLRSAIKLLRQGVVAYPSHGKLREMLGAMLSDANDFSGALKALEEALACPDADQASALALRASTLIRMKRWEEGLEAARQASEKARVSSGDITDAPGRLMEGQALFQLQRFEEARQVCLQALDSLEKTAQGEPKDRGMAAFFWALHGMATLKGGLGSAEEALEDCRKALLLQSHNPLALTLRQELRHETSPNTQLWEVIIQGRMKPLIPLPSLEDHEGPLKFSGLYRVAAESQEEALEFIRDLESRRGMEDLEMLAARAVKSLPTHLKGVVNREREYKFVRPKEKTA
jgi:tetratricopeptide (TPR) repeat protein